MSVRAQTFAKSLQGTPQVDTSATADPRFSQSMTHRAVLVPLEAKSMTSRIGSDDLNPYAESISGQGAVEILRHGY